MSEAEWTALRGEAEAEWGRIKDETWKLLRARYPDAAPPVEDLLDDLEAAGIEPAQQRNTESMFKPRTVTGNPSRVRALSSVLAADAAQRDEVEDFRGRALPDGLLTEKSCAEWIRDHVEPMKPKDERLLLAFGEPGKQWTQRVAVGSSSLLGELARLSGNLADLYPWQEQQATVFVLTDAVPLVAPIRTTVRRTGPIEAKSRIILEVDPWTDPREVASAYIRARGDAQRGIRRRPLSDRAYQLAEFVADRRNHSDVELRRLWNRTYKEWAYPDVPRFVRAYSSAIDHLLDPKLD